MAVVGAFLVSACGENDLLGRTTAPTTDPSSTVAPSTTAASTAAPSTTASSTTVPPTTTAAPRRVTLAFTGDSMAHDAVLTRGRRNGEAAGIANDFTPMWQLVQPVISRADLAVCHIETTIAAGDATPTGFPRFRAPREYLTAIKAAGYDACSTASNHSYDYGVEGVVQTIDVLEQTGLQWSGTARSPEEGAHASMYTASGVQIAHLSASYGLNGFRLPDDKPWLVDLIDVPRLLEEAGAARAAGADIVVVSLHCCTEYRVEPTATQVDHVHQLLASPDVDLVVGHHAHVVQPIERVGEKWAVYGLGNILSNMYDSRCCPASSQDGVIVEVAFAEGADGRFAADRIAYTPTWVDREAGFVITPVEKALADPTLDPRKRAALKDSWWRTVAAIGSRGAGEAGLVLSEDR